MSRSSRQAGPPRPRSSWLAAGFLLALSVLVPSALADEPAADPFDERVRPVLEDHCFACHGNGLEKGGVALDGERAEGRDRGLWWDVLKNVRAGVMPPPGKPRLAEDERRALEDWIKAGPLGIDPADPDPGRVTVRRLNRVEYRNTVRDLLGVDYDTTGEFPPDDTGHGFDNIGDVLTLSPLLLEKYLAAAEAIVAQAVPTAPRVVAEHAIAGRRFRPAGESAGGDDAGPRSLSYYEPATVATTYEAEHAGRYRLVLDLAAAEKFVDNMFDYNRCRLTFQVDGAERLRREFGRQDGRPLRYEVECDWPAGPHELAFALEPLTPGEKQVRSLAIRIQSVNVQGPLEEQHWVEPARYRKFFPRDVPAEAGARRAYARERLGTFARRAFRRPVEVETVERLVTLADRVAAQPGQTFEAGVARAMAAVLTSPRFLFREEGVEPGSTDRYPLVDEHALASRLSYFLWSTMPDDELTRLADEHQLRANLKAQVDRMMADPRSAEFVRHFVGQWLQARDVETVLVNAFAVINREQVPDPDFDRKRARFRELIRKAPEALSEDEKKELAEARASFMNASRRFRDLDLTPDLRRAMRRETEMLFEHVLRGDRPLVELIDSDYTFLNERLAKQYGIDGVKGDEMRLVPLPPGSPRGGVLTQGTVLAVTSNPDRTSPVKRGLFILDNILGTPPPPPPPDIPPLEDPNKRGVSKLTLRESLERHRNQPSCMACHARMDPLGLALENFNALGRWRDTERGQPIDAKGTLVTGESFTDVREMKRVLAQDHRADFLRCLSEKLLTYALGRGLDAPDVEAVDRLVGRIESADGRAAALLMGVIESTPFQRRRRPGAEGANAQHAGRRDDPSNATTEGGDGI